MYFSGEFTITTREVGTPLKIYRDSGDISGEFVIQKPPRQVTKPFTKEFFREFDSSVDTQMVEGDVVQFTPSSENFMVVNLDNEILENVPFKKVGLLYKANVSGEILRPSGETWGTQTYHKEIVWNSIKSNAYALVTEPTFGNSMATDEPVGNLDIENNELYIPRRYGLQVNDRYLVSSGEYYRVDTIVKRRYPQIDYVILDEDNR